MTTQLKDQTEDVVTSGRLFEIEEDGAWFEPYNSVNGIAGKYLQIEHSSDDEDGTYPSVTNYIKLVNRMDNDGTSAWLSWISGGNKLKFRFSQCTVIRESKYGVDAEIVFDKPITVVFGRIGEQLITGEVSKIKGEFTHEWFWMKGNRRQDKVANGFEIYFDCKTFE
jgi:hypothetical protein